MLAPDGNTDKSLFFFSTTQNLWLKFECRYSNTSNTFSLLAHLPRNNSNHPEDNQTHKQTKYLKNEPVISKKFPPSFHERIVYDYVEIQGPETATFVPSQNMALLHILQEKRNECIFNICVKFCILHSPLNSSLPFLIVDYNPTHKLLTQLQVLTNFLRRLGLALLHWLIVL